MEAKTHAGWTTSAAQEGQAKQQSAYKYDANDDVFFVGTTLIAEDVPYPDGVTEPKIMAPLLAEHIRRLAPNMMREQLTDVTACGEQRKRTMNGKAGVVQTWRLSFTDAKAAFKVLRAKASIHEELNFYVNEELSEEEQQLKSSRLPVYKVLRAKADSWAQWRGPEIYVNSTRVLDPVRLTHDGRPLLVERGMWRRFRAYNKSNTVAPSKDAHMEEVGDPKGAEGDTPRAEKSSVEAGAGERNAAEGAGAGAGAGAGKEAPGAGRKASVEAVVGEGGGTGADGSEIGTGIGASGPVAGRGGPESGSAVGATGGKGRGRGASGGKGAGSGKG